MPISDVRKKELLKHLPFIFTDIPTAVFGSKSLAQEISNRIESITKKPDEYKYLVDAATHLILQSKGAEIQVVYKGKVLTKEQLFKDHGAFINPGGKHIGDEAKKRYS